MSEKLRHSEELIAQMKDDFASLLEFKNELEALLGEQGNELKSKKTKNKIIAESLQQREHEINGREHTFNQMKKELEEARAKARSFENKLRSLKQNRVAELTKKVKDQTSEIDVLKEMLRSSNKQIKVRETDNHRLKKKVDSLERISNIRSKVGGTSNNAHSVITHSHDEGSRGRRHTPNQNDFIPEDEAEQYETMEFDEHQQTVPDVRHNGVQLARVDEAGMQDSLERRRNTPRLIGVKGKSNLNTIGAGRGGEYVGSPPQMKKKSARGMRSVHDEESLGMHTREKNRIPDDLSDVFSVKYYKEYDDYVDHLGKPEFKNNSYGMKSILSHQEFELPKIHAKKGFS